MTKDVRESLTALVAVSLFVGLFCLAMLLIPNDMEIPAWVMWIGGGLDAAILMRHILRRLGKPAERPE